MPTEIAVLTYHRICTVTDDFDQHRGVVSAAPGDFEAQLKYLKSTRTLIATDDLIKALETGQKLPPKATVITFDDGYLDNYIDAFPILRRHDIIATFFISTGYIDQAVRSWSDDIATIINQTAERQLDVEGLGIVSLETKGERLHVIGMINTFIKGHAVSDIHQYVARLASKSGVALDTDRLFMNWKEVKEMSRAGMIFAPHTDTHKDLTSVGISEAKEELQKSTNKIASQLGYTPEAFAYPYGQNLTSQQQLSELLNQLGFKVAFTTEFGSNTITPSTNLFLLKRYNVHYKMSLNKFKLMLWDDSQMLYSLKQHVDHRLSMIRKALRKLQLRLLQHSAR